MNIEQLQQPDTQTILTSLQSDDSDVIRSAAFAAGDEGLVEAVNLLCTHIQSANIGVQEAAEYALRKIRGPETIRAVLPLLRSEDAPIRNIAMDILREIGSDDIAAIQPLLRDADPDMRIFMSDILGCTGSRQAVLLLCEALLKDPEVNVRYQAAVSLGTLAYPEAVDALRQAMHDEEWVQFSVIEALTKIRADSTISALVQSLTTSSPLVSSIIIDALGEMGNIKAVPLLFKSLEKTSSALRHKTVKAIVQILGGRSLSLLSPKDQERFKQYLGDALTDEEEDIQKAALSGLSVMGDSGSTRIIMDLALKLDRERDSELHGAAINALAAIGYNDAFAACLSSSDSAEPPLAVEACLQMQDHRCIEHLRSIYWNLDRDTQRMATAYIAKTGEERDVPFVLEILKKHTDGDVLKHALYFLGVRIKCTSAQDSIFAMLDHPHDDVKEVALDACIHLQTPELTKRFKDLYQNGDAIKRMMAVYALSRYNVQENISELTVALEDESANVRQLAVEGFSQPGMPIEKYITHLMPRLCDESHEVRAAVVELLGHSGQMEVVPHLISALNDDNEWVRIRAVEALGSLKNEEAAPQLVELLAHASPMLAFKIIDVLGKIGGNVAFRALLGMMDHEDIEIQHAAAEAVSKIKAEQE